MDPLDPLTEIISSGQAFSPAIALERFIWSMIGFFLIGALFKSLSNSMRSQNWFSNKSISNNFESNHNKSQSPKQLSDDD